MRLNVFLWFLFILGTRAAFAADAELNDPRKWPPVSLHEQVLSLPGDTGLSPALLEVTLYEPDGKGPFPLAILNHGADTQDITHLKRRYRFTYSAFYFLSRGYAVAMPMMRGFGNSDTTPFMAGCRLDEIGLKNARDLRAVIDHLTERPEIDSHNIVMAGQSFGGWNTLAYGTLHDGRVKGLINFAGGIYTSDCLTSITAMMPALAAFGAATQTPSLWVYGDNDKVFPPSVWHKLYKNYVEGGGKATLLPYGSFMNDAHQLLGYPEGVKIWTPAVDRFLAEIGMPNQPLEPAYLPVEPPPASGYAEINDVAKVPYLHDQGIAFYEKFLSRPLPRAIVIVPDGTAFSYYNGFDPYGSALADCRKHFSACAPYAIDNDVVWRGK